MGLDSVVLCAGGLRVAQRGAPRPTDAPALSLQPVRPVRPAEGVPVEARRSDAVVWRRHWLEAERLVIEFVGIATVEVDEGSGSVVFDRPIPEEMEQHLLFDHVLPLVLARRGGLVLHGGLVSRRAQGVVLMGASGAGKSTLTAFAWQAGWTVGGDDGVVLSPADPPTAEPTYSTIRLSPQAADALGIDRAATSAVAGKVRVGGSGRHRFRQEEVALRLVAIIEPAGPGARAALEPVDAVDAHARLFGSTFHAELTGTSLLPSVVDALASIVETTAVRRLTVPRGLEGLGAAEALLRAHLDEAAAGTAARGRSRQASGG